MKKQIQYIFIINCLFIDLFSCASTGNLNFTEEGIVAIESVGKLDYKETFIEKELITTKNIGGLYWKNPNEIIASNFQKYTEESKSFTSKNSIFLFLKDNYNLVFLPSKKNYENFILVTGNAEEDKDINLYFYCINKLSKNNYALCSYYVFINYEKLELYDDLSRTYQTYKELIDSNNRLIEVYYTENLQRSRQVPYTDYRTVQKSRPVTRYRTVYGLNGYSYQQAYTDYEYYNVQEAYTAYRTEYYSVPNPDYNPIKGVKLEIENDELKNKCSLLADRINSDECDFYEMYYN